MKYIEKGNEPVEFTNWKNNDKMFLRGKPNWKRPTSIIKEKLRNNLLSEQGFICCYCERKLETNDFHIEHLMPKNLYPEKQLDYSNLICSCQLEIEAGEPRHCGNSKGSWYDEHNFISPLNPACETKFKYTYDGHIEANDTDDEAAEITIKKLKLYIDKLNKMRESAILPFIDYDLTDEELKRFVEGYLVDKNSNDGKYNVFYTTIEYLFSNQ